MASPMATPELSILVVEDDEMASATICQMLARKFPDITIYLAYNGNTGLEVFQDLAPDIIITDINMPGLDGIRMAGEMKAIKRDTRFIVITGYSDTSTMERFREIGFDDYIVKPLNFRRLFAGVATCIDEIILERQLRAASPGTNGQCCRPK